MHQSVHVSYEEQIFVFATRKYEDWREKVSMDNTQNNKAFHILFYNILIISMSTYLALYS